MIDYRNITGASGLSWKTGVILALALSYIIFDASTAACHFHAPAFHCHIDAH